VTLPEGWIEIAIEDVASVRSDKVDPKALGSMPFIGLEHIEPHTSRLIGQGSATDVRSAVARFRAGDVLYGRLRPYLNKVIEASFDGCASAEIVPFTPHEGVSASLLRRLMMSEDFLEFTASLDKGDRPRVSAREVGTFKFKLPPENEQLRIVVKLDALNARLMRARAELDRVPLLSQNLRATALRQAYDCARLKAGFCALRSLLCSLDQGWSPKCESYPSQSDHEWAVLKTTAVQALRFQANENKVLPTSLEPRPALEIAADDILVTRAGPRVRCGISCVVKQTRPKLIPADKIYRLRAKPQRAVPDYLAFMLNAPQSLETIEIMKTGMSDSGLNITQDKFLELQIPALDYGDQEELVKRIEAAFDRADRLETEAARARALLNRLEAAILARAFRGELVPQDPNDEPAGVLLERIRAQRSATPKPKRGRQSKELVNA